MTNDPLATRADGRARDALRPVSLETGVSKHAEGSCLARFGDTHVLITASVENRVPGFLKDTGRGWVRPNTGCCRAPPAAGWTVRRPRAGRAGARRKSSA